MKEHKKSTVSRVYGRQLQYNGIFYVVNCTYLEPVAPCLEYPKGARGEFDIFEVNGIPKEHINDSLLTALYIELDTELE